MAVIAKQRYKLDIAPKGGWVIVYASQHDDGAREIEFEITNQGKAFSIPASINVSVQGIKSNGSYFSHSCSYSGNIVTMALADDMTDIIGKSICVLKFTNSSQQKLATTKFVLSVDTDSSSEGIIIDTDAEEIFNQMLNEIRAQAASISADIAELQSMVGSPLVASTASAMTDHNKIYVYVGSESGYTNGNWYYWNGSAWTSGGVYNAVAFETDTTLTKSGQAADAKKTGDAITSLRSGLKEDLVNLSSGKQTISGVFAYGVFNSSNMPETDPRKFNAVMMTAETYGRDIILTAKDGYNFLAYFYDANDNYVSKSARWETSRTIPANTLFRLWVRPTPLDPSIVLDLNAVKHNIVFNTKQQDDIDRNTNNLVLNTTNINLNGAGLQQIDTDFVWGSMNASTGAVDVSSGYKWQVVMPTAVHCDRDVTIKCNAGYRYQVWWYSASDEYISRTGGFKTSSDEYVVTAGTYFRLFVTLDPPNNQVVVDPSVFTANVFLVTVLGEKVDAIVNQPLSTLPEYVLNTLSYKPVGPLSKGYILMSCDDGTAGLATYTIPMLISKGVPATFGLLDTSPVITNDAYLTTVIDAVENHGCCVAQHGSAQWPTYSEKALTAYFDATKTLFTSKGISEIHGAICPGGADADTNTLVKAIAGGRFGAVFSGGLQDEVKYGSYNAVGPRTNMYAMARYSAIGFTQQTYQQAIDDAYENHFILCPFWHDYSVVNDTAKQAIIEGMIDYAKTKGLTFITMADLPNLT